MPKDLYREVPSESTEGKTYDVEFSHAHSHGHNQRDWTCTCPNFRYGGSDERGYCKHIRKVREANPDVDPTYKGGESFGDMANRVRNQSDDDHHE